MPELPDIELYRQALEPRLVGRPLVRIRLASPFLVRSVRPRLSEAEGRAVTRIQRLGKRLVFRLDGDFSLVLHLMVAGRLRWLEAGAKIPKRNGLAAFDSADGTLLLTEASSKKRASLYLVDGEVALAEHDPGGLEVLDASVEAFRAAIVAENRTLKRALTDPRILSGIGNAYSDEILHRARMSPFKRTRDLTEVEIVSLLGATVATLTWWRDHLVAETGDAFPKKVTAFRPEMAVHGKYGQPCPRCNDPVQRIVYAENEANYCATCQTGGKLLADRVLSQLMKGDWPRSLEELESHMADRRDG